VSTQLLTLDEAGTRLGVSAKTVHRLIALGKLRAADVKATGSKRTRTRVRDDDLQLYIESITRETRAS
jgi:excisionase family DNA binding protein